MGMKKPGGKDENGRVPFFEYVPIHLNMGLEM